MAVLENQYVSLEDHGVPLSVCLQLQQLGLQLHEAQWTAIYSLGGFSLFFSGQPWQSAKKKKPKESRKNTSKSTSHQKPGDVGSPANSVNKLDHSPIVNLS